MPRSRSLGLAGVGMISIARLTTIATAQPAPGGPWIDDGSAHLTAPEAEHAIAGYDKGFFLRSADDKFRLRISARLQAFYTLQRSAGSDLASAFSVRDARLTLEGNLYGKGLTYKFQSDFGQGFVTLKDFHVDAELATNVWVRAGQWKRPFSRQQITSSGRLEIADRAITNAAFGAGRDIGIALRNDYEKSPPLEWTVGLFNGTGTTSNLTGTVVTDPETGMGTITGGSFSDIPRRFKPALIGRIGVNSHGLKGYSEADLEGGPARAGVAASIWLEGDLPDNDQSNQKLELDYVVKAYGLSTTGGFYAMTDQDGTSVTDAEVALVGFHVQGGAMFATHWQLAARYALVNDPQTKAVTSQDQQEIAVAANYYAHGHDAKIESAIRFIKSGDASFLQGLVIELATNVAF